jgi:hypothetical protein
MYVHIHDHSLHIYVKDNKICLTIFTYCAMEILGSGANYVISLINKRTYPTVYKHNSTLYTTVYKHNSTLYNHDALKSTAFFLKWTNPLLDKIDA